MIRAGSRPNFRESRTILPRTRSKRCSLGRTVSVSHPYTGPRDTDLQPDDDAFAIPARVVRELQ